MFTRTLAGLAAVRDVSFEVRGALTELEKQQQQLVAGSRAAAAAAADIAQGSRRTVEETLSGLESRAAETTERARSEVRSLLEDVRQSRQETADALDDLVNLVGQSKTKWTEELKEGLDALSSGALDFREFLRQYGDMRVQLGDENKRISELLADVDPRQFKEKFQDLLQFVRDDKNSIAGIAAELEGELEGRFDGISELLRKFEEKKVSFAELKRQLEALAGAFEGSDLDTVIQELLQRLQEDQRSFG